MSDPTPFDGKLPPGWEARPVRWMPATYDVWDEKDRSVFQCLVDRGFPVETHARYAWWRHTFPDAPPVMYLRFEGCPDWLPEFLRPGTISLDDLGSLGG